MSFSTDSRRSSLFSLASCTSSVSSLSLGYAEEKPASPQSPVLSWKPLLFSTAFTSTTSTPLRFTSFPPVDLKTPRFEQYSIESAELLFFKRTHGASSTPSFLTSANRTVCSVDHIPIPESLPRELLQLLGGPQWEYYHVTDSVKPIGLEGLRTNFKYYVAVRWIEQGVERYTFGPAGLCLHSILRVVDAGASYEEDIPRETLLLHEKVEIICNKCLKWWAQSWVEDEIKATHEQLRQEWDRTTRYSWELAKSIEKMDVLDRMELLIDMA